MTKQPDNQPELISLRAACRRAGIVPATALKLEPAEKFPQHFWLGGKRVLPRRAFEVWLAQKVGNHTPPPDRGR